LAIERLSSRCYEICILVCTVIWPCLFPALTISTEASDINTQNSIDRQSDCRGVVIVAAYHCNKKEDDTSCEHFLQVDVSIR